ncbi:hypothetical protein E2562_001102 [Oryza meyeriana var. granulata]|uniref:Uncharacterized protein n=1 Tax=Oryza meyeriana var. granulata TaxID=110450 RepID=A0A6G1ED93_9ORYZ|nr:hypothetical protein E2562_001102 [Oryza meyeriana var. granulata]
MEGLIPLLYKAIKDRRTGRAAYPDGGAGVGVDLYDLEQRRLWLQQEVRSPLHPTAASASASAQQQHQRNLSLEELAGEVGLSPDRRLGVALPKARSVRVFSCIGAA